MQSAYKNISAIGDEEIIFKNFNGMAARWIWEIVFKTWSFNY